MLLHLNSRVIDASGCARSVSVWAVEGLMPSRRQLQCAVVSTEGQVVSQELPFHSVAPTFTMVARYHFNGPLPQAVWIKREQFEDVTWA